MDVLVMLGSSSDLEKARPCVDTLKEFNIDYKLVIASAHRTPLLVEKNIKEAEKNGTKVIIAMAGLAAHLPGVIASKTLIPVIGVPLNARIGGLDALYSIVQMPKGFPVATVGIDISKNASLLAIQILALNDKTLKTKLKSFREKMASEVEKANKNL
jgi:5-(carboxyamino)imidazole ribonucleotide mutase